MGKSATCTTKKTRRLHNPSAAIHRADFIAPIYFADNPLECSCELTWYNEWLKRLRGKDDELMQKKKTMCVLTRERHEYNLKALPLERMNCVGKNTERFSSSANSMGALATLTWAASMTCPLIF
jgi:hypothetical protein